WKRAEDQYHYFNRIHCPYFHDVVTFSTEGFRHLLFKSWNRSRNRRDQFMRLKHIAWAPEVIRMSRTVQDSQHTHKWERRNRHGRWEQLMLPVAYYEFIAVFEERRFKVIVKQLQGGERILWSLIPFWRQSPKGKRVLHLGNPAAD